MAHHIIRPIDAAEFAADLRLLVAASAGPTPEAEAVETMPGNFRAGTLSRLDAVLHEAESRADLMRSAVERELKRRENNQRSHHD